MEANAKRKAFKACIVLVFLLVIVGFMPAVILAQGHSTVRFRETAGPYEIGVVAIPSGLAIGRVHFVVTVLDAATRQPVPDAKVVLRVEHELDSADGWGLAVHTTDIPERYDAEMNLNAPGTWRVDVEVSSSLGKVSVEMPPVVVSRPRRYTSGSLVFVGVSLVLILGVVYLWWSIRREQRKRTVRLTHEGPDEPGEPGYR